MPSRDAFGKYHSKERNDDLATASLWGRPGGSPPALSSRGAEAYENKRLRGSKGPSLAPEKPVSELIHAFQDELKRTHLVTHLNPSLHVIKE